MRDISENLIAEALTGQFGERCPDFEPECHTCKAWRQYDDLRKELAEARAENERLRAAWAALQSSFKKYGFQIIPGEIKSPPILKLDSMDDILARQAARPVLRPPSKAKGEKK